MRSVGMHSTSGKEEEGNKKVIGSVPLMGERRKDFIEHSFLKMFC
jgi:hypothetical protein